MQVEGKVLGLQAMIIIRVNHAENKSFEEYMASYDSGAHCTTFNTSSSCPLSVFCHNVHSV